MVVKRGRRAGVPVGVGVQGEHRRVEHRVDILVGLGIRRFGPGRCVFDAARPLCARTVYIDITAHRSEIYVSSFLCCTCVASSFGVSPVRKRARALAGARADARTDLHSTLYRVIRIVNVTFYRYGCKERASCTRTCRIGNTRIEQTCMHRLRDNIHAHLFISRNRHPPTQTHTNTHTYIYKYTHTHIYIYAYIHTYIHIYI